MGGSPLFSVRQYLKYRSKAVGPHALHSPFVFDLFNEVIKPSKKFRISEIEEIRKSLKSNHKQIEVPDFKSGNSTLKLISSIAKSSLSKPQFSAFLHLLAKHLDASSILETGTSLGINSLYLSQVEGVDICTIEGSESIGTIASQNFKQVAANNISHVSGDVNEILKETTLGCSPDFVFLDADHRGTSLLNHIEILMTVPKTPSCIVIHDINWSEDMNKAWQQLVDDPRFPLTLDIFQAGLLFPNKDMEKQHFTLRF